MGNDYSRRVKYSERQTRKPKPGKLVYGEKEDTNRWYRCGFCGFINDIQKTEVGGDTSPSGVTATAYTPDPILPSDGTTPVSTVYKPVVNRFCALCGSPNWYK